MTLKSSIQKYKSLIISILNKYVNGSSAAYREALFFT
jgi:hypothetical protein